MNETEWADALAAWRIPPAILDAAPDSPWVLPEEVFSRRADQALASPGGVSYQRATEALGDGATVLDVGAGGGAASLPHAARITSLTAVDSQQSMLEDLARRAARLSLAPRLVVGRWPEAAADTPVADVVLCHHVLYNVAELAPFVRALTAHARRRVIVEITERHPLTALNPYWQRFHGLKRPEGPTADDAIALLRTLGLEVAAERWRRPATAEYASFGRLVDVTRRRLCLPPSRAGEVAAALKEEGVSPDRPPDLGSSGRELVTIGWPPPVNTRQA
jgi:SAM-dependent methyltransferase